ncbi:MAG TPA: HEAT repeat domain-containing protein [Verrucomicrobiae bacterium]|nr:HEAT repeat domain-containing protein [Verrucomicrobiae bacterium]
MLDKPPGKFLPQVVKNWVQEDQEFLWRDGAMTAFYVLGKSAAPTIPTLFQLATNRADEDLARYATMSLACVGPDAMPELLQILTNAESPGRDQAILPLSEFGTNSPAVVTAIVKCVSDPDYAVSDRAAEALGKMPIPASVSVPPLIGALKAHSKIRARAIDSLAMLGAAASPAAPDLTMALTDEWYFVRVKATNALEELSAALNSEKSR